MTFLTILRHAKSSWDHPGLSDFDRPLNDRGRKAAPLVGREMRRRKMEFDIVFASPAVRVRQTIDGVVEGLGKELEVQFDPELYAADVETLLTKVRALPGDAHAPLMVGHNPGLHEIILYLARDDEEGLRAKIEDNLPTAAAVTIELPAVRWDEVEPASGLIRTLILPRDLD
ncbi:SixA phosphatase family protein [Sphingomonas hankyongi]|uniref:Histidine phosphatase family protein n=1 Tax=Sphingomonas hankyongi TaxID=2908209 RepID=A0ABT0S0Q6_9SPHN|nr:histidine phosphatase family protein [Sphingomonas hankyongi]MCL6729155.1 histidine phosphatase family protein [Sphingomonas hankyongi]